MGRIVARAARVVAVSAVGSVLVVAGLVMLVTPGPGLLVIFLGLAVFAREFRWAERLKRRAVSRLRDLRGTRRRHPERIVRDPPGRTGDRAA